MLAPVEHDQREVGVELHLEDVGELVRGAEDLLELLRRLGQRLLARVELLVRGG